LLPYEKLCPEDWLMVFDSAQDRAGGREGLTPLQVAHHPLFTAREKIELLQQIKAEITGAEPNEDQLGFSAQEVDAAIAEVRAGVQNGVGSETVFKGDA
jgi:hypothetical protein